MFAFSDRITGIPILVTEASFELLTLLPSYIFRIAGWDDKHVTPFPDILVWQSPFYVEAESVNPCHSKHSGEEDSVLSIFMLPRVSISSVKTEGEMTHCSSCFSFMVWCALVPA